MNDLSKVAQLQAKNPNISELINTFDLSTEYGEVIPVSASPNLYRFSLFYNGADNTKNTAPRKEIDLEELVRIIKSDKMKNLPKKERPYITPYGTFHRRNNDSLATFNKDIICLDYDKLKPYELNYISNHWKRHKSTILSLISPSGNGLKVLVKAEHGFKQDELYNGLKANAEIFRLFKKDADVMQFVLSQPMFIPYSEEPYFNPSAEPMNVEFNPPEKVHSGVPIKVDTIKVESTKNTSRVNRFFTTRVNMLLESLQQRPLDMGTHNFLWSVLMRIYPYLNQQTAVQEHELTTKLERIILSRYNNDKSQVSALHRSIAKAKEHQLNLVELINQTAKIKI
tara:strand:- start:3839 stop:4858 length:1020 start_codon:yes stop_codon:yes gene_type:complete